MPIFTHIPTRTDERLSQCLTRSHPPSAAVTNQTNPVLRLQHTIGNRAVQRLVQTKVRGLETDSASRRLIRNFSRPKVSSPGDAFNRAVAMVSEGIQHTCVGCEDEQAKLIPTHRTIFRRADSAIVRPIAGPLSPVTARLISRQAEREPLAPVIRRRMEKAFGQDFSRVRIHRDPEAAEISRQLGALAFTYGNHIYFRSGMYDPAGSFGKRLLAHELTHVAQHGRGLAGMSSALAIHRFSYVEGTSIHQDNNLANTVLYGKDVGITYFILNGTTIKNSADVRTGLKKPTLSVTPGAAGGFDARVQHVPMNVGKVDETVLAARSWKLNVTKATVPRQFPHLTACRGSGRTVFQALGSPSDPAMFAASRRHEDHHAHAFYGAFMGTVYWWDTELDIAAGGKTPYHGATKAEVEAKLWGNGWNAGPDCRQILGCRRDGH